ncbi:thioredoxin family protein [Clostridium sp. D2Q-11]|uniref:Thioredoxin family protein n=1 Tax=Anaeromonas frigoriresistens TaxID=2683708 RepID=A0A942UWA1_9FIRM|nr:thioredoxin family protein [Anaeromonas frigoriresistens]MBS4538705.1 thioredoxin family protein [Anaeromonas frigoriresistens]
MKIVNMLNDINSFIDNNTMSLIMFSTDTCSACVDLTPKIEELVKQYPKLETIKVDMNELTEAAGEYSIFTIPTILLYIDGKETIRKGRFISIEDLDVNISRYYEMVFN